MNAYYEYNTQYSKEYKKQCWDAAIGLQAVDGLKVSNYLKELSDKEISGELSDTEIENLLYQKYESLTEEELQNRQYEADIVSARIVKILKEPGFSLSPVTLCQIHKQLFEGIYEFAGEFRTINIYKNEPILNGESVKYANYNMITDVFAYDFNEEKSKSYVGLTNEQIVKRIAHFTSCIWQVHPFREGNTRTTAVFMEKYLNFLGFSVDNSLFKDKSLYFRNALVRANYADYPNNIINDNKYIIHFYENLLYGAKHDLHNRDMLINEQHKH